MAKKNIRVVPKISNNLIAVYICIPSTGESRQVALVESQEGTFPDACIATNFSLNENGDIM